jgi:hypothetical protein
MFTLPAGTPLPAGMSMPSLAATAVVGAPPPMLLWSWPMLLWSWPMLLWSWPMALWS